MAYRISPEKSFSAEVRRIAKEQLEEAIAALSARSDGLHEAIHDARKDFKRLRALYRLAAAGRPSFRGVENARIRDMARTLSAVRDATALVEVCDYLSEHAAGAEETAALARIRDLLAERRDAVAARESDLEDRAAAAIATCRQALAAVGELTFDDARRKTAARLEKAWIKRLQSARDALAACEENAGDHRFHELRKRSQDYWMFLALLRPLWPSALRAKQMQAKQLAGLLGHEHDLSVLCALVNEEPKIFGRGGDLAHLLSAIIVRQQQLRQQAVALAGIVFADGPRQEGGMIAALWLKATA